MSRVQKLVAASAIDELIEAVESVTGRGVLPEGWDWEAAELHTDNDWPLLQAAFLIRTHIKKIGA